LKISTAASQRGAAKQFGVAQSAISDRLSKGGNVIVGDHGTSPSKTPSAKPKAAGPNEPVADSLQQQIRNAPPINMTWVGIQ